MKISVKYGEGYLMFELPDSADVDIFEPRSATCLENPVDSMHLALDAPLGCPALEARPAPKSVAIAVPDETRPFPIKTLLPPFLERLFAACPNLRFEDVTLVVGGGLHPPADEAQLGRILPENLPPVRVVSHDAEHSPMTSFGRTSRGTPVEINAAYAEAELKIVMGMVDTHQFVGFTGGAKGVTIGCASAAMIAANHRMLRDPAAVAGNVDTNPVRQDLNESGEMAGVALAINVVLDASKRPVAILAGKPPVVMREASGLTAELYGLPFKKPYDLVIASSGGRPKDVCLYQAQKGLNSAMQCAAPGATLILAAKCEQGIGDDVYLDYVSRFSSDADLIRDFESGGFRMGAHKAYLFARSTSRYRVFIHSDLEDADLKRCLLEPCDLQTEIDAWMKKNPGGRIAVLKNANSSYLFPEKVS